MTPSELRRLAEEYIEAQQEIIDTGKISAKKLNKISADYQAALTPEIIVALCKTVDATENLNIAIGMGWDLDGVIGVMQGELDALTAAFTPTEESK